MKYFELIKKYEDLCKKNEKEIWIVKLLLLHITSFTSTQMYLKTSEEVPFDFVEKFEILINKHIYENIPLQYLTGYTYFFGNKFLVSKDCLIPRKETEELVENFLYIYDEIFPDKKISLVDIGTGSGCIGLTIKKELGDFCEVTLTDVSHEALEMAKKNQKELEVQATFKTGDMLEAIDGLKFDCLISNPPYIPEDEFVCSLVKDNEPNIALFGGGDGLKFYKIILSNCKKNLNIPNIIGFEHAYNTQAELIQLINKYFPNAEVRKIKDLQNKDRMIFIINK